MACNQPLASCGVQKIDRVLQPIGSIRFDLFCKTQRSAFVLRRLQAFSERWGWHCRYHRPFLERHPPGPAAPPLAPARAARRLASQRELALVADPRPVTPITKPLRVSTLNIHGAKKKTVDLHHLLRSQKLDAIALQETLLRPTDFGISIPNYQCFSALGHTAAARRGVSVLIRSEFRGEPVGPAHSNWLFVRVSGQAIATPTIIGSVYLPHGAASRPTQTQLAADLLRLTTEFPSTPLLLMGDFNLDIEQLQHLSNEWPGAYQIARNEGDLPTVRRTGGRSIDHICLLACDDTAEALPLSRVLQDWDISDHYPVVNKLPSMQCRPTAAPQIARRTQPKRIRVPEPEERETICRSNRWSSLAEDAEEADAELDRDQALVKLNAQAAGLREACHSIAKEMDLHNSPRQSGPSVVPTKLRDSINRRRKAWRTVLTLLKDPEAHDAELDEAEDRHSRCRKQTRLLITKFRRKLWHKRVAKAHANLIHNPKLFWKWASYTARWNLKSAVGGVQPIMNSAGELVVTLPEILAAWRSHFKHLASDITGNSGDPSKWQAIAADDAHTPLNHVDDDIVKADIWRCVAKMKAHSAPGNDGIPSDFYRACLEDKLAMEDWVAACAQVVGEPPPAPPCHMTQAILEVIRLSWDYSLIPDDWTDSVVVSIPKKGDLSDTGNYRGISLMCTALKILCVLVSERINLSGESLHRFSPCQAGFRSREECVTHAACFIEIVQRRRCMGLTTFALFVDLKKAYDMVPHEALFAKLRRFGLRGKCYQFVVELYRRSTIRVRVGHGPSASFTDAFDLERGLRQGCPLSCVLFNIFINDMFDDMPMPGTLVPSGRRNAQPTVPLRCPGLLFADDLVGLSSDPAESVLLCAHITAWCDANEMEVGIHKCGLMEFEGYLEDGTFMESVLPTDGTAVPLLLCRQPVPIVETYSYLGIEITKSLSYQDLIRPRLESGRKTVHSLSAFLSCPFIPMSSRWLIVQVVVLPRLLYGAEIYGMNRELTDAMQQHLNYALRCVLGIPRWKHMSSYLLWQEMRMKPICAIAAGRRARAYSKSLGLKTWVTHLVNQPLRIRKWTWVSGTTRWIGRFCKQHSPLPAPEWDAWWNWEPAKCREKVEEAMMIREFGIRDADGYRARPETREYKRANYTRTSLIRARVPFSPAFVTGLTWISRFRTKTVATAARMLGWGRLTPYWNTRCPCCSAGQLEDEAHILLECSRWHPHRQKYLRPMLRQIGLLSAEQGAFTRNDRLALLLGGSPQARPLPEWLPPRTDPYESDKDSEDDSSSELSSSDSSRSSDHSVVVGLRLEDTPVPENGSFQVAAFLTLVMRLRQRHLGEHPHWPQYSETPPIRTPGQRPAG
jgi:exonuclease III